MQRLKHYGWGREGEGLTSEEETFVLDRHRHRLASTVSTSAFRPSSPISSCDRRVSLHLALSRRSALARSMTAPLIATASRSSIMPGASSAIMRMLPMSSPTRATTSTS